MRDLWLRLPRRGVWDRAALAICCLGAFVCAVWVAPKAFDHVPPDFRNGYYPGAMALWHSGTYEDAKGRFISHWPPGYSLLISPFVADSEQATLRRLRLVHGIAAILWVLSLHRLIRQAIPAAPPWLPLAPAAFWPPILAIGNPGYSELPLATMLAAAAVALAELSPLARLTARGVVLAVLLGGLLGAAALTKTLALPVAGAALVALVVGAQRRRMQAVYALAVGAVILACLLPWLLAFRRHTGHLGFTTAGPASVRDGLVRFPESVVARRLLDVHASTIGPLDAAVRSWDALMSDPPGAARLIFVKVVRVWFGTHAGKREFAIALCNLPWMLLFLAASGASLRHPTRLSPLHFFLFASVWAVWLSASTVIPLFRYFSIVFPFAVIVVCAWFVRRLKKILPDPLQEPSAER